MDKFILIVLLFFFSSVSGVFSKYNDPCALKACQKVDPNKINVHLVPHSHDDVGWLKTVDDYFYGKHNDIHNVGVQYILDSVLQALKRDANRRYIQVETAFFWKWWQIQPASNREMFKNFVDSGRIEMVGGGWSMNDEACVNYQSTINQFTWGLRLLNDTLGECGRPKIGWQIDPFGHSREQASIFQQMGYDAIFFTRMSEDERKSRKLTKDLEFIWRTNDDFENSDIFTSIMDSYYAPSDFCWDYLQCSSDAINDDPDSFDYNLDKKVAEFSDRIANYSSYFLTNNILFTMGGDFQYQAAEINYLNMDKLIKGFQDHPKYNVFYSTPSCYVQAVKSQRPPFEIKKSGDFFPYKENDHVYWSGYYTSRSTLKRFERTGNNILQAAQQINAFGKMMGISNNLEAEENLRSLREAVGTMQHHDAITGTEKERVAKDYARMLTEAIRKTEKNIGYILGNILKKDNVTEDINLPLSTCLLTNISVCDNSMKDRSLIVIYNPLPKTAYYHLRLPVQNANYSLTSDYGEEKRFELVKHMKYPTKSPYHSSDTELVTSQQIPPMGIMVLYLQKLDNTPTAIEPTVIPTNGTVALENGESTLTYNTETHKQTIFMYNRTVELTQNYMFYRSNNGSADNITSGAYVFRPVNGTIAVNIAARHYKATYLKGQFIQEITEYLGDFVTQTIRLFVEDRNVDNIEYVEYDWIIGPLDNDIVDTVNNLGKEVIVRYSVNDVKNYYFFTDSNGRQMIERIRVNLTKEPVAGNYYPVTSRINLPDYQHNTQFSVLTDRSQGGANLYIGKVELMLHRRTLMDDHKGVEEPLQEMEFDNYIVTRGQHYVTMNNLDNKKVDRLLALNKLTQPWVLVADATPNNMTLERIKSKINFRWLGLKEHGGNGLPDNINILNLEPWKDDTYLLRLEHIFAKGEDEELSQEVSLPLKYLFEPYLISSIAELSLGANEFIDGGSIEGVTSGLVKDGVKAGCVKCHRVYKNKTNVHLIPHSHDDVGWLKTVDQYYYGLNTSIQQAGVQYIITSVFEALLENEDRRYIQVETQFFWKWWQHITEDTRTKYKHLVENGQIEMVNGAWSMNDEACSNYQSTIDQFTWGLRTLDETVGDCGKPRVGWQIDPFGHSREQASLLSQMGYDGVFFARLDHDDKSQRQNKAALDFAWKGSDNLDNSIIFGSIFATSLYFPPDGFCWDYKCSDDTIIDNPESPDYNIKEKVKIFTELIDKYQQYFPTNNIIIPMGGDFQYEAAEKNYNNMDKFIKAFEGNEALNVLYSTPSCYIKAVNEALDTNLTLKTDDFFPYSDSNHSYWAGYFTSRPNSKRFERIGHNILQATKQLYAQNSYFTQETSDENLRFLKEIMGVMQHHDAITGTEKQHVANDYVKRLSRGINHAEKDLGIIVDHLLNNNLKLNLSSCLLSNISICGVSQNSEEFVVAIYNPLAWEVTHYVRLPVEEADYQINGNNGEPYDLIPTISDFSYIKLDGEKPSTHELVFAAKNIPPLGLKLYHIKKTSKKFKTDLNNSDVASVFEIDNNTNLLKSVSLNGMKLEISQNFEYYYSNAGESDNTYIASGAYLFRPTNSSPEVLKKVDIIFQKSGKVVDEVHQKWTAEEAEVLQTIRWYKDENYLEFDWIVGNIDITSNKLGKEFISKFTIMETFNNNNIFYTDSNGREMIKRTKNSRPDYTYNPTYEPVSSNYYPITSRIVIKDESKNVEVAVLTDRSQGGTSLEKNEIELMVHRRITHDDDKGVGESLNETEFGKGVYVRGSHYLVIGKASGANSNGKSTTSQERILAQKKLVQPWIGLSAISTSYEDLLKTSNLTYEGLSKSLPENVNILTFEPWTDGKYLLRLEHIMETNDDTELSKIVSVDIARAFKHFDINDMIETTLAANQLLSDYQKRDKYVWKTQATAATEKNYQKLEDNLDAVSLTPMKIRTFIVTLKPKQDNLNTGFGLKAHPVVSLICLFVLLLSSVW